MHIYTTDLYYLDPKFGRLGGPLYVEDNNMTAYWDYDDFMITAFMINVDKIGVEAYRCVGDETETLAFTTVTDLDDAIDVVQRFADMIGHDSAVADKLAAFGIDADALMG